MILRPRIKVGIQMNNSEETSPSRHNAQRPHGGSNRPREASGRTTSIRGLLKDHINFYRHAD